MVLSVDWTLGAKLPLYRFKRLNEVANEKVGLSRENKEPPVPFLESLLLGEVYVVRMLGY